MAGNLTISALLTQGIDRLRTAAAHRNGTRDASRNLTANATLDAEVLLAHSLTMTRTQLKTHPERVVNDADAHRYAELVERRATGEPVAYILGYRDFWTFRLAVNPAVLVPRPETELLVERVLALGPPPVRRPTGPRNSVAEASGPTEPGNSSALSSQIADLGTGSGAIALALATERPDWSITATDLSEQALTTARANAAALGLSRIEFLQGSWFAPLSGRRFDLIASNPPYVPDGDIALQDAALQYEPQTALTSGADGMTSIRQIIQAAPHYLQRHGWLILEHGFDQAEAVARELVVRGFGHVRSHTDLAGHPRVTEAQWE